MQLAQAKREFDEMAKEIADRRKKLLYKIEKGNKKENEKVDASKAEKFKSMVILVIIFRMNIEYLYKNLNRDFKLM